MCIDQGALLRLEAANGAFELVALAFDLVEALLFILPVGVAVERFVGVDDRKELARLCYCS